MILRPGNAGANTAADHVEVLAMALLALPKPARGRPILLRADSAGATHVEDRIRSAKATGLRNLPFWGFAATTTPG